MNEQIRELPSGHQPIAESKPNPMSASFRKSTSAMQMQAIELRRQGVSAFVIASQLGVSRNLVYIWLRKKKVVKRKVVPQPRRLKVKAEMPPRTCDSPSERARIVFSSGIILELAVSSINGELIRALSEVR